MRVSAAHARAGWKSGSSAAPRSPTRARSSAPPALIARHPGPLVVVASALAGVTDLLLEGATPRRGRQGGRGRRGSRRRFLRRHRDIARELLPAGRGAARAARDASTPRRASIASCAARSPCSATLAPRASDMLVSRGERMSATIARGRARRRRAPGASTSMRREIVVDRRAARRRGAEPRRDRPPRAARCCGRCSPAARTPVVPGFIGQAPDGSVDDARARRIGSDGDAARADRWARASVVLWKDVPRHPDRRSAPRAGRAAHSAAASSRGGGSRALRRQGAAPARADPDRRHAHRAARPLVPRSASARHRGVGAPLDGDLSGQGAGDRARPGDRHGRRQGHGRRARHRGAHVRARSRRERLSVSTIFQASSESSIGFTLPESEAPRAVEQPAPRVPRRAGERAHRQRHRAAGHGGRSPSSATAWPAAPGIAARVFSALATRRHQRRRDRAGVVGAQHLVRGHRGSGRRGGAPRPHRVSAVEDRRRPAAGGAAHRRRAARVRPGRPRARGSDRRAGERPARRCASSACSIDPATSSSRAASRGGGCSQLTREKDAGALPVGARRHGRRRRPKR